MERRRLLTDLEALVEQYNDPQEQEVILALAIIKVRQNALRMGVTRAFAEKASQFEQARANAYLAHPGVFAKKISGVD